MSNTLRDSIKSLEATEKEIIDVGNKIAEALAQYARDVKINGIPRGSEMDAVTTMGSCLEGLGVSLKNIQDRKKVLIEDSLNFTKHQTN